MANAETVNANGVNRFGLIASVIVAGISVLGIIGSVFYIAFEVRANSDAIKAQDVLIGRLEQDNRKMELDFSAQKLSLNEIETQFCATDIVRNLMHANDMRVQTMLWEKTFGNKIPTDNVYYPTICNRKTQ